MKAEIAVIVPPVVCHNLDPHTGIPFMPHMAAYIAGALKKSGLGIEVFDCFGLQHTNRQVTGEFMLMGASEKWVADNLSIDVKVCFIYCRTMAEFIAIERMVDAIKRKNTKIKICLFENVQAVTSFSLKHVVDDFMDSGVDVAIIGEPEDRAVEVLNRLIEGKKLAGIPAVAYKYNDKVIINNEPERFAPINKLPRPAWELFPLRGYWKSKFAHAPKENYKILPLLTSRGCPFKCTFCIAPEVNPKWRARDPIDVVDEIEYFYKNMGVSEFHISDLNPTVNAKRTKEMCREIIKRKLDIKWKLAQGTKIETIKDEETLELMAKAGCKYISFSPESGSPKMLEIMKKPFNHEHALKLLKKMNALGIRTQACFIAGVPGETEKDRELTFEYANKLIKQGLDELAVFIFTPVPGSVLSKSLKGFTHYSQCTPSPTWRKDYKTIASFRRNMYINYFLRKLMHPSKVIREAASIIVGRYQTKMEMSLMKQLRLYFLRYFPWLYIKLEPEKEMIRVTSFKRFND